jgi:hypothetical protein
LITFDLFVTAISCPGTILDIDRGSDADVQATIEPLVAEWSRDFLLVRKTVTSNPYAVRLLGDDWGSTVEEYSDIWMLAITHGLQNLEEFNHDRLWYEETDPTLGPTRATFYQRAVSINGLLLDDIDAEDHTVLLYFIAVTQNAAAVYYVSDTVANSQELTWIERAAENQKCASASASAELP